MANIWSDATAPYVLVAALGAMGWIVNTSVNDLKQSNIVEYEIKNFDSGGKHLKYVDISNRSLSHNLLSGKFSFRCKDSTTTECFSISNAGTPVTALPLHGISNISTISVNGPVYLAEARLAAQSAIRYVVDMKSASDEIVLLYEPGLNPTDQNPGLIFRSGRSWEGWLIANYLGYLVQAFIGLAVLLGIWLVGSLLVLFVQWCGNCCRPSPPKDPETFKVIIIQEG